MKQKTIKKIIQLVANNNKITYEEILSKSQSPKFATPRMMCYFIFHKEIGLTSEKTSKIMGKSDHSTIISGCRRLLGDIETNNELKIVFDKCLAEARFLVKQGRILTIHCSYKELFNDIYNETKNHDLQQDKRVELTTNIVAKLLKYN